MVLPCCIVQDLFLLDDCKIILSSTRMDFFCHQPSHNRRGFSSPSYSLSRDLITSEIIHLLWKERNQTILHYEWNQSLGGYQFLLLHPSLDVFDLCIRQVEKWNPISPTQCTITYYPDDGRVRWWGCCVAVLVLGPPCDCGCTETPI